MMPTGTRRTLEKILNGNLDFHGASSTYASHALHAFAAKFPPQLPGVFIEFLTQPHDIVLDPMMGSGTAILEALLLGRRAVGVDIDPLAVRLCRAKTNRVAPRALADAAQSARYRAFAYLSDRAAVQREIERRFDAATLSFVDYWFLPETQQELMALLMAIEKEADSDLAELLRIILSSIIITKSGGVSRATDLAHSRPHRVASKKPRSPIEQFNIQIREAIAALKELPTELPQVELHQADARNLPLATSSVDLVITSPPYANAIDYMRAHKFSLVWLGEPVAKLSALRSTYVGSENCQGFVENELPPKTAGQVAALTARDERKARILSKYLGDMERILAEILRVLRPGRAAGIVVGPSTMRGIRIQTHEHLAEIASRIGFDVVGIAERKLDRDRRMMPTGLNKGSMNGIEQRVHEEFVIGLTKP